MNVTITDIATEANVSRATVSRVLNSNPAVKPKTAALVRQVIDRLGYSRPNGRQGGGLNASRMPKLRCGSLALISIGETKFSMEEPTLSMLIGDLQNTCLKRNLNLLLDQMNRIEEIPLCIRSRQVDGAIIYVPSGSGPVVKQRREIIAKLASLIPVVHLFTPGHPIATVDHVTTNDVAIGALAYRTLKSIGCQHFAVVDTSESLHEALNVRGRALLDRAASEGHSAETFAAEKTNPEPARCWPAPLTVYQSITEIATALQNNTTKAPIGIFLLVEQKAPELHLALKKAGLLQSGKVRLLVAGVTPKLVETLEPKPILIDLLFSEIIETAVERLIQRILNYPNQSTTSLIAPRLIKSS